jgi:hypothetical protein
MRFAGGAGGSARILRAAGAGRSRARVRSTKQVNASVRRAYWRSLITCIQGDPVARAARFSCRSVRSSCWIRGAGSVENAGTRGIALTAHQTRDQN